MELSKNSPTNLCTGFLLRCIPQKPVSFTVSQPKAMEKSEEKEERE